MSHIINDHFCDAADGPVTVAATDEPGNGNANHEYVIGVDLASGPSKTIIRFQDGAIQEVGVNGLTNETLLAIVADRLRGFQSGPYACLENALALKCVNESIQWHHQRTRLRLRRSVEGTSEVTPDGNEETSGAGQEAEGAAQEQDPTA